MKGLIQENHISKNNFELQVVGLPTITFIEVSDISEEIDVTTLPDRTQASGGTKQAGEFTVMMPAHHDVEVAAMEAWFLEGQDPVAPTYKKSGVYIQKRIGGEVARAYAFTGLFVSARSLGQMAIENEGEMQVLEYTFKYDDILPTQ